MKKLFATVFIASSLLSNLSFAKTEGSYLSLDALYSEAEFYQRYADDFVGGNTVRFSKRFKDGAFGGGLSYRYAVNFEGPFLALGGFVERNGLYVNGNGTPEKSERLEVKNRFGLKTDLGYDVLDSLALYISGGYAGIRYGTRNITGAGGGEIQTRLIEHTTGAWFYGAGLKIDLTENISLSAEYHTQKFNAKTRVYNDYLNYRGIYKTRLNVAKIGIAYNF